MPLDTPHPAQLRHLPQWQKILDCVGGEDVVKERALFAWQLPRFAQYLPPLNFKAHDNVAFRKFADYVMRAEFPDITGRTVRGLMGMLFRRPPTVDLPASQQDILEDITGDGTRFIHFARQTVEQVIAPGRVGIAIDAAPDGDAYQTWYQAANVVKWWVRKREDTGETEVWRLVLRETFYTAKDNDQDDLQEAVRWREMRLVDGQAPGLDLPESGRPCYLIHQLWYRGKTQSGSNTALSADGGPIVISRQGQAVDVMPFVFGNPSSLSAMPEVPIMLGIANTNLAIFRNSADLENGRHWTGRPQPYWFGIKRKGLRGLNPEIEYGSSSVWTSENDAAHAGFVSIGGDGLKSLETGIETKKASAVEQGARLVEARPTQLTATQSLIKEESDKSTVMTLADTCSDMLSRALGFHLWWNVPAIKLEDAMKQAKVTLNPDRGVTMSPEAAKAWAEIQLFGTVLSKQEAFDLFKRSGVYDETITYKDHNALLAEDALEPIKVRAGAAGWLLPQDPIPAAGPPSGALFPPTAPAPPTPPSSEPVTGAKKKRKAGTPPAARTGSPKRTPERVAQGT